jgi:copper(I)-binding protein
MTRSTITFLMSAALSVLILAGCGDDGTMAIEQVWARPTAPTANNAAFYGTITNETGSHDRLVAMSSPACEEVELHRSSMTDGVMSMRPAEAWENEVLGGHPLELEPGGLHLMCFGLSEPLVAGETAELELTFVNFGSIVVDVAIEDR